MNNKKDGASTINAAVSEKPRTVDFGEALAALKSGLKIARLNWMGNKWITLQKGTVDMGSANISAVGIKSDFVIKKIFNVDAEHFNNAPGPVKMPFFAEITNNKISVYNFQPEDLLATDWVIREKGSNPCPCPECRSKTIVDHIMAGALK